MNLASNKTVNKPNSNLNSNNKNIFIFIYLTNKTSKELNILVHISIYIFSCYFLCNIFRIF